MLRPVRPSVSLSHAARSKPMRFRPMVTYYTIGNPMLEVKPTGHRGHTTTGGRATSSLLVYKRGSTGNGLPDVRIQKSFIRCQSSVT